MITCGKGHEQSMCFGMVEYPWDDRTALRAALAERLGVDRPQDALPADPGQLNLILTKKSAGYACRFFYSKLFEEGLAARAAIAAAVLSAAVAAAISTRPAAEGTSAVAAARARAAALLIALARFFRGPAFQDGLAGKADLADIIDIGDHHGDFIAHLDHIFHLFDPLGVELGDVDHAVDVGQDLDECAEIGDAHHLTGVDSPDLGRFGQGFDALAAPFLPTPSVAAMKTVPSSSMSILVPVSSCRARIILPPGPMIAPILSIGILMTGMRGACGLSSGRGVGNNRQHLVQDEQARLASLGQRLGHDLGIDALDLDIHLQGSDAPWWSGDFEIHIAQVIFDALDIGQDDVLLAFLDQAHGHAGDRGLDRHAGVHQGQGGTADGSHRGRAVGRQHFGDQAQGVGEFLSGGMTGTRARSARAPWPISRREVPRRLTSPVE